LGLGLLSLDGFRSRKFALASCAVLLAGTLSIAQTSSTSETTPAAAKNSSKLASSKTTAAKPNTKSKTATVHRTSARTSVKGRKSHKSAARKPKGQQKIDSSRTQEIQQALIREHYLSGNPSGNFDDATQQALRRYQAANGWQSKTVPDSRALIKLGLGPDHEHLLNPESAMTMPSQTPHNAQYSAPTIPVSTSQNSQQ
jgi:peptidoglycan hydrolase-like protein with peptidoglycan-binding domain